MEKRALSYTAGVNVNGRSHYEVWRFLKKLQTEPTRDPATPLPGIYPEKTINKTKMGEIKQWEKIFANEVTHKGLTSKT